MKTTVVMTTYNGSKFVLEQMDSLRLQSRPIDEVLIFDDCSTDDTVHLVNKYITDHNLYNWTLNINESGKGWKKNFFDGINKANGDIVFPCDQDDIWHHDKVESMANIMERNGNIDVLVGKYHSFFMDNGKENSLWGKGAHLFDLIEDKNNNTSEKDGSIVKRHFDEGFLALEPGCCFCIRKSFIDEVKGYWIPEFGHDAFYTFFSEIKGTYYSYNKTVIEWRHFSGSTSRPKGRSKSIRISELQRNEKVLSLMRLYISRQRDREYVREKQLIQTALEWNKIRTRFINTGNIILGFKLLKYYKFYDQKRAVLTDWLYAFQK